MVNIALWKAVPRDAVVMDNAKPIMPSSGNVGAIQDGLELVVTSLLNATVRIVETMTKVRSF